MNIFHRIYKLHQKNIPPQQIAATTKMPLKSVKSILRKIKEAEGASLGSRSGASAQAFTLEPYLDSHVRKKHTHVTLDFSGFFTTEFIPQIENNIYQVMEDSSTQRIVLKLADIYKADANAAKVLRKIVQDLSRKGRSLVLFSPSESMEAAIQKADLEKDIRILGTQAAFDNYVYNLSSK
jgi:anti-anti-sigma regulatory factor